MQQLRRISDKGTTLVTAQGRRVTVCICLVLYVFALVVRWWGLPEQAHEMYGDEAQILIEGRKYVQGVYSTPFMIDSLALSAFYDWMLSLPLRLTNSMDITVARAYTGAFAALSTPLLYLTARELGYPWRLGLVAAISLATTFWNVHWSRLALPNIMPVAASSVAILLLVMAVRRYNPLLAALAGVALGWTIDSHLAGAVVGPILVGWLGLLVALYSRWWRSYLARSTSRLIRNTPRLSLPGRAQGGRSLPTFTSSQERLWVPGLLVVGIAFGITAFLASWPVMRLYFSPGNALSGHAAQRYVLSPENRLAFAAAHPNIGSSVPGLL